MCKTIDCVFVPNGETTHTKNAVKYLKKRDLSMNFKESSSSKEVKKVEVVGEGTRLMKKVKLPTVLVRVSNGDLEKSRLYYVLLESEEEGLPTKRIPAIMLSDTSAPWRTHFAELFPLSVISDGKKVLSIRPLLYRTRYMQLFTKGCSFKVLAIETGRSVESSRSLPWNQWKLKTPAMRNLITETLYKDIRQMPKSILARVSKRARSKKTISYSFYNNNLDRHDSSSSQDSAKQVLSTHYPSLRVPGIAASGGSSFAQWFRTVDPNIRVDKNFKCARGTTLRLGFSTIRRETW